MDDRARHIEENVISTAGQPHQRIVLRGRHDESFRALDRFVKTLDVRRNVVGNDVAPEFRAKADDEVHSSGGGAWFADRGNCGRELVAFLFIEDVEFQVSMR